MQLRTIKSQLKLNGKLKWYYRAYLVSLFHHINQAQRGTSKGGPKHGTWGCRDTARELHMSLGAAHNYIKLNAALTRSPELKKLSLKKALAKL